MALTSQQIVTLACQIAKVPGYTAQGGQLLNFVLHELAQTYDFDFYAKYSTIDLLGGTTTYDMPADHLRTREAYYYVNGQPFYLNQIDIRRYHQLYNGPGVDSYPTMFAVDVSQSPNQFLPYQPPTQALTLNLVYFPSHTDITTPETSSTVPWFPQQTYLVKSVAARLLDIADDPSKQAKLDMDAKNILSGFLSSDDDKEGYPQRVKLDRGLFRPGGGALKPTKNQPL